MLLGHEGTGVVVQAGAEVGHVREGDHVIVTWVTRTPLTEPQAMVPPVAVEYRGQPAFYNHVHTWSEHVVAVTERVVPIAPDVPTDVSCIVGCAVLTGAGAVLYTAGVRPGDSVAVFGVGGVGLSALRMAALLDAHPVIAVDLRDDKLQFARRFGATHTVNAGQVDPVEAITDLTGGGVDYAFDTIGVRATARADSRRHPSRLDRGAQPRRHGRVGRRSAGRDDPGSAQVHDAPAALHRQPRRVDPGTRLPDVPAHARGGQVSAR